MTAMSWADTTGATAFDDVLLPLEFEDLARSKPRPGCSLGFRAAWLLRKAALFDRLASTDPTQADTATAVAGRAREAGRRLQAQLIDALTPELVTCDEGAASRTSCPGQRDDMSKPREEAARPPPGRSPRPLIRSGDRAWPHPAGVPSPRTLTESSTTGPVTGSRKAGARGGPRQGTLQPRTPHSQKGTAMKPDNGRDSGNHSNNYDPGVKVGNEVSCFSDALPQPGQIQALKRPDPRKYGAGLARGAPPGPRVRRNSEPAKPLDGGMSVADKGDPASRPQVSDRRDSRSGGQQERPTPGVTPARTLRPGHRTHRKVGTAMKPGNGSSCGNSTGSGTTGTVTMADGITHTVRGAGEMHTLAEHDSKSQL